MLVYIKHIIWRYIEHKPDQYRLLDVRHNVMKNLIIGDCNNLIKFILFGNKDDSKKNKKIKDAEKNTDEEDKIKHIPRNLLWKRKEDKYIKDDDLDPFENNKSKDIEKITPRNDMELAIYHCKGKFQ